MMPPGMPYELPSRTGGFPSTSWSRIQAATGPDEELARQALGELLTRYQSALLAYAIKRFGADQDQARDWFQGFVLESVLRRGLIAQARPIQGHQFRSYLLSSWHKFILGDLRRQGCRKRRPRGGFEPISAALDEGALSVSEPAAESYDLAWARAVLDAAIQRMKAECAGKRRSDVWGVFDARVLDPIMEGVPEVPYGELIARFGLESPIQARNLLGTGKRMFARCLQGVIGDYAEGEAAVAAEVRELQVILKKGGGQATIPNRSGSPGIVRAGRAYTE
jgi:DNA-directed RNA polymerase specialized sigma24 family protein